MAGKKRFSKGVYTQKSYIQIVAEPEISIFLDNEFKGVTFSEMGGLIIGNISPGSHLLRVVKKGFNPQEEQIVVTAGEVYTYKVKPFIPKLKITETGNTGQQQIELEVGKLKIQSIPISISISIPALGIDTIKNKDKWLAEDVPVGTYSAVFKKGNKSLSYEIEIESNIPTHLFVNLIDGEVEKGVYNTITDIRDNQIYKIVEIGDQIWMAENLKYLPDVSPSSHGSKDSPHYYVYGYEGNNVPEAKAIKNYKVYGVLYNWEAARKSCPKGWHLPSDKEWKILEMALGMTKSQADQTMVRGTDEGKKLKSTTGWYNDGNGIDAVGFSALPGGYRYINGKFYHLGFVGLWWSATEIKSTNAWRRSMYYDHCRIRRDDGYKAYGFNVRCIKDEAV